MTTPILKNLVHVVRRFKLATILNILGLSVAFAAFMVIMMQLSFHFGFDRFHKDYDKIFRMEVVWGGDNIVLGISRPMSESFFDSSPHIVAGARFQSGNRTDFFAVERNSERNYFRENVALITPEFTDVFTLDFVEGSADALRTPDNVMIPLSMARRMFGYESAVGRQLILSSGTQTVGAVFRDFPVNSTFQNVIYATFPEGQSEGIWGRWTYTAFIRVNQADVADLLLENFMQNFDFEAVFWDSWEALGATLRLTALPDLHFATEVSDGGLSQTISRHFLMILLAIGLAILIIAAINFTNFSTALAPMRIRNINTQRVVGAQQSTIRWILVIEAVVFAVVSYFLALLLVHLLGNSTLANLVTADLLLSANVSVVLLVAVVAIVVGVIAGLYPSRYMTSFAPAMALKGNFALSPKGKKIRNMLIGIQFVASFALIIVASFMYLQNRAMQNVPLGYDANALITVNTDRIREHRDVFTHRLNEFPGIAGVTHAEQVLTSADSFMSWGTGLDGERIDFQVIIVQYDFLQVMGIEVTAGRDFRREDESAYIFNETARQRFNLELNTIIDGCEIIGFMPDIKFASSRSEMQPMAFYVWSARREQLRQAYIQLSPVANRHAAMAHIRSTLAEFDPNYPFEPRFHDEVLQRVYERERSLGLLITLFSLIAILISIVGVFGLVVFDSECRRKEIGIRKVHGASTMEIITMFNKSYFAILLICFVIAVPVAWIAVSRWLENFAYRTPMYWWVYLAAFVAVAVITVVTVTVQNWRVANEDPVRSIKTE